MYKLNYNTDEKKLKKDFEIYGPIKRVRIIRDKDGKSRGYGFIEYEHKADFKTAYKRAENRRIDNTPVQVDYERGRTEKNWKPRRLGGEKGNIRELPGWLERELRKIKEMYPELTYKNKRQEGQHNDAEPKKDELSAKKRNRSRSRSRDKITNILRKSEEKKENLNNNNKDLDIDINKPEFQLNIHVVEENKLNINMEDNKASCSNIVQFISSENVNFPNDNKEINKINDDMNIKSEDGEEDEKEKKKRKEKKEKKDKKHKRDKKEKKHKKDKKEKKSKKDKRDRKERLTPELEVGEIV